jgi:hypothetical protein
MSVLTTHTFGNKREKEKKRIKKLHQAIERQRKGKEQNHFKKTSLVTLT